MNRGEMYWVDLNPTIGSEINKQRPCVLVGATAVNKARHTIVVVPLSTSAKARPPVTIAVNCLGQSVVAVCDQIRTIDKLRLKGYIGVLSDKDLHALDNGLRQILSL